MVCTFYLAISVSSYKKLFCDISELTDSILTLAIFVHFSHFYILFLHKHSFKFNSNIHSSLPSVLRIFAYNGLLVFTLLKSFP